MLSRLLTIREQVILAVIPAAIILGAIVLLLTGKEDSGAVVPATDDPVATRVTPVPHEPSAVGGQSTRVLREVAAPHVPKAVSLPPPSPPKRIGVAVRGAVARPGLYYVDEGRRVQDLLREAGGVTADADMTDINISAHLQDATTLTIPTKPADSGARFRGGGRAPVMNPRQYTISGWTPAPSAPVEGGGDVRAGVSSGLVNVNTADAATLERLPGIGPVLARRILAARSEAPFSSLDDLARVRGIGAKTIASLRPYIRVR